MQVLKWKFTAKFDKIYLDIVEKGINVEFKDISQLENKYLRQYNGLTDANKLDNNKVIVYLNGKIDEKEIEHIAAHELCHIIINKIGYNFSFRINDEKLLDLLKKNIGCEQAYLVFQDICQKMVTRSTFIKSTFTDIVVDICMKNYGFNATFEIESKKANVLREVAELDLNDNERTFLCALIYVSEIFRKRHSCTQIELSDLEQIYIQNNKQPILITARKILEEVPETSLLDTKEFYELLKKIRSLYFQIMNIPSEKIFLEIRNPWTGEAE